MPPSAPVVAPPPPSQSWHGCFTKWEPGDFVIHFAGAGRKTVTEAWPAAEKMAQESWTTASKLRLTNDHDWWRKAPRSKNVTFPPGCPALSNYSMSSMHTF